MKIKFIDVIVSFDGRWDKLRWYQSNTNYGVDFGRRAGAHLTCGPLAVHVWYA